MPRRVTLRSWEKAWWSKYLVLLFLTDPIAANAGYKTTIETLQSDLGLRLVQDLCNEKIEKEPNDLNSTEDGLKLLNEVIVAVEKKLSIATNAIIKLRDELESIQNEEARQPSYDYTRETNTTNCCQLGMQAEECVFQPSYVPSDQRVNQFSERVAKVIRQTYNETFLSRQYYAKPNGAMISFPANRFSSCNDFDPRNRSWYFETATVRPKDVVVVVDTSRSMEVTHIHGRSLMELVRKGAQMVVNTLTSNDRVAVIGFSDTVTTASQNGCYSQELAVATPQNKKCLSKFIERLRGKGLTNYVAALTKAAQYFNNNTNSSARDQILLFLSDGMPTTGGGEADIMNTIQTVFHNTVRIMTFGIGKALQDLRNRHLLMNMSNVNHSMSLFNEVNSSAQMVNSVADYYTRDPAPPDMTSPVFTLPYFDVGGNDFVMSVCLPVRNKTWYFNGVTCIDASINNLFKDIINFKQGESSYAFLINNLRRVLHHPLLPKPSSLEDDIGLIDIGALERDPAVQDIVKEMTMGRKGQKTIQAQQIISRGDPRIEGVEAVWHTATYAWAPIANTNFSVCVVFRSGEASPMFPKGFDPTFTFHIPTRKYWHADDRCLLNNRLVLNNKTSVEFPVTFFKNGNDTAEAIDAMTLYMRNQTDEHEEFKKIRNSVTFTADTRFWRNDNPSTVFVWRYLATYDGVLRVYPGITLNNVYDVRQRSWYQRTLNNKGKLVFSGPYLDFWGSGYVVSISQAICKGSCEPYLTGKPLVVVIGGDVTIYHLYDLLIQNPNQCDPPESCILIDNSGYIVLHHDYIYPKLGQTTIGPIHITVKEPEIAQKLVDENILHVKGCIDMMNNMNNKYFWQIPSFYSANGHFTNFNFYPIHHTNLFLIKKKPRNSNAIPFTYKANCKFVQQMVNETIGKEVTCVETMSGNQLQDCSCSSTSEFNHCKNTLDLYELSDFWPTCMPESARNNINMSLYNDGEDVKPKPCKPDNCQVVRSQRECRRHLGCMWCLHDSNGDQLTDPHCVKNSFCYFGILGHTGPYNEKGEVLPQDGSGIGTTWLVVISCTAVIPVFIIIVICIVCIKRQRRKRFTPKPDSLPILLRTSLVDIGVDNPSLLWNPLDQSGSIRSKTDALSMHKLNRYSGSTTSGSIQHLTEKVEALVHHLEHQSAIPSPLPLLGHVRYESDTHYPYYPRDNTSVDSQSVYTRSSSRPTSMVSSIPSSPSTAHTSISRPRPRPRSIYHLPPSRTSSIRDQVNSSLRPTADQASEPNQTHPPCTRQPSERTWPGEPIYPTRIDMPREPSERTCPCTHQRHHHSCNSRPCSVYSTRSDPSDWVDLRPENGRHPEVIPEVDVRRTSSFRQRRIPSENLRRTSSSRSNSVRSRRPSSFRMSDDSIRAGILRLFQEFSNSNISENSVAEGTNLSDEAEEQECEVHVMVEEEIPKSKNS